MQHKWNWVERAKLWFYARLGRAPGGWQTEEDMHAKALDELDSSDPDWDIESRILDAAYFLKNGSTEAHIEALYGKKTFVLARRLNEKEAELPAAQTGIHEA